MPEGSNASSALSWVRADLDGCLESIRVNLESFAEDTSQRDSLVAVQERLEQLNLTFLTMQQRGAGLLTDEMIAVGGHMLHNRSANHAESLSALTDAVIVLPAYLDRLQAGHDDLPILLLPTLNELRATYDESLMSEGTLFAPDLDVIMPELSGSEANAVASQDFTAFARRVRSLYQGALLGWLKEQSKDDLLVPMQDVCRKLYTRLGRNELRRLWWIAGSVMEGLRSKSIDNDLPLRRLFARLDLTLKAMIENGEQGPGSETITALSRALLFYAAQARPGSKATDVLRERFRLEELIPDREALMRARGAVSGRDAGLFRSIGEAIREELGQVKDTLDMELRTGRVEADQRAASMTSLQQLADTLNMLNLPVPARAVENLLPALEDAEGASNTDLDSPLLALAQKLLEVESILDSHIQLLGEPVDEAPGDGTVALPGHEQRHILSRVLDESVNSLHAVQEAIRKRLDGDAEADYLGSLQHISGALAMVSRAEVAALTDKLGRALNAALNERSGDADVPNLEPLSDAVAALELFLAGCRDEQADSLRFLDIIQERLAGLPEAAAGGEEVPATTIVLPHAASAQGPAPAATPAATPDATAPAVDPAMLGIFLEEFDSVRAQLHERLPTWLDNPGDEQAIIEIRRGFHTLKGSGRMVGAREIGDFAWRIEELLNQLLESRLPRNAAVTDTVELAVGALDDLKSRLLGEDPELDQAAADRLAAFARTLSEGGEADIDSLRANLPATLLTKLANAPETAPARAEESPAAAEITAQRPQSPGREAPLSAPSGEEPIDPTLQQLMVTETRDYLSELEPLIDGLLAGAPQPVDSSLVRAVHTLAGTLAMAPLGQEAEVARGLERYLANRLQNDRPATPAAAHPLQACLHRFHQRLAVLEGAHSATYPPEDARLLESLAGLVALEDSQAAEKVAKPAAADAAPPQAAVPESTASEHAGAEEFHVEEGSILSIFLEEATEILERCDSLLNAWRDTLSDRKLVQNLQREVHTFKGGARMAGLDDLGELSHAMESLLERIAANRLEPTVAAVQAMEEGCDRLTVWVEQLKSGRRPRADGALERFEKKASALADNGETAFEVDLSKEQAAAPERQPAPEPEENRRPVPASPGSSTIEAETPASVADRAASARPTARKPLPPQPKREFRELSDHPAAAEDSAAGAQIRVAAELVDKLVNYAGEISIYRSRLEQQLGSVRFNLKEVDVTVDRLKEQLRKMEMESEAQMMSRYQSASTQGSSEFDPLELDRFSNMQQLSRALSESVSDLLNLQEMMDDSVRQAESLLTQQSRVSADLQEGLMQTRMTPFGNSAPRLRRVVRAAASETGKKARLQLRMAGSSDQLDRNVLERITAPLEHMLRNAVAHGIEAPKVRRKRGKPEEGSIVVTVEAEATEFVIRVEDDGAGIDLDAVRRKAIERGMLGENVEVDERRLVNFIRESGFSTSAKVTGLAGRGVGMDVVNSEIQQISGSMDISSTSGAGTCFTIRIPFSLAVMQAIGVTVGERAFQIPLNSVAGVARMTPADYSALLNSHAPTHEFAGELFPLLELEPLLGVAPTPLNSDNVSLLMIRTGEHRAAFRVSSLQGHQEVVIKPVGPQISSIPGILGGTIAVDGQVMIILDMGPLIRRGLEQPAQTARPPAAPSAKQARQPLVMVVDDSITMRKVTSRVLENHSVEVMTAQDGLDAVEQLHERIPDLMLLDIEMPRMDGYELAQHVRADARLRHVPIVMITSRAGQKHRKKARESGANAYLTKPYQEAELVAQVGEMLEMTLVQRRTDRNA